MKVEERLKEIIMEHGWTKEIAQKTIKRIKEELRQGKDEIEIRWEADSKVYTREFYEGFWIYCGPMIERVYGKTRLVHTR